MLRSKKFVIAVAVVAIALGFLIFNSLQSGSVYYYTVTEYKSQQSKLDGQAVRVIGKVASGSVNRDPSSRSLQFTLVEGGQSLPVTYARSSIPDAFGPDVEVVVQGTYKGDVFQADTILTKCPSKYEAQVQ